MKIKLLLQLLSLVLIIGCASTKKELKPTDTGYIESPYDESFDPLTLNDDDITITPHDESFVVVDESGKDGIIENTDQTVEMQKRNGFRIQISATSSLEKATLVQQEVSLKFTDNNLKAYLIYETPLYKVRVGDALDRDDANVLRDFMRENGYKDSFVVPSKIVVHKDTLDN